MNDFNTLPSLSGIQSAYEKLPESMKNSPLVFSERLSQIFDAEISLKLETLSLIASFKLRGAFTTMDRASKSISSVVTSSTGNHGQAVAYCARWFKKPGHIFLPNNPNPLKKAKIQMFGATIHEGGGDIDEAKAMARDFADRTSALFIDDGESFDLIEGAGTVGLEIAMQAKDFDLVMIPMGSGSLVSGSAIAIKSLVPKCQVIAVQSAGSPTMHDSFHARRPIERPAQTIADGIVCRVPAELALRALIASTDNVVLVQDEEILSAIRTLALEAQILVEPAAAASFAGLNRIRKQIQGKRVVLCISGANIAEGILKQALKETRYGN